MKTVRVRICVVVDDEGRYQSSGWKDSETIEDGELIDFATEGDIGPNFRIYFMEADLALPTSETVQGTVDSDVEDAHLFRLWIREASERPGRLAQAIADCVTPDEYREVLRGFSTATDIEDSLHSKQEEA
jgi:hypothetical protein